MYHHCIDCAGYSEKYVHSMPDIHVRHALCRRHALAAVGGAHANPLLRLPRVALTPECIGCIKPLAGDDVCGAANRPLRCFAGDGISDLLFFFESCWGI